MKLLVFEYITGGGLAGHDLPASLAAEGRMMLQALLNDLKSLPDLQLILPLDERCLDISLPSNAIIMPVTAGADIDRLLPEWMAGTDGVWPIAPETGGILAGIAKMVKSYEKNLLLSAPETVELCGDKLATFRCLKDCLLPVVESLPLAGSSESPFPVSVIKPIDGVGCEGSLILEEPGQYSAVLAALDDTAHYLIQPLCEGQAVSLSCLFKQGKAWLICCNRLEVASENNRFRLQTCWVNADSQYRAVYQELIGSVAQAMPGLWGYVGIDIIETDRGPLILEINPRLTTSYVGIKRATGINVAEQTLRLLEGEPEFKFFDPQPVQVRI